MATQWPVAEALLGGTPTMRAAGKNFLPMETREAAADYEYRLSVATLFPAFRRTITVMAGKPFSKPLTFGEDVPETIKGLCDDCDLEGRNLHTFMAELMQKVLAFGLEGVLVDYPVTAGQVRTLADEKAIGARPYLVPIKHSQILGWKTRKVNGVTKLAQLRIAEVKEVEDGPFGVKCVKRVRVLAPGSFEVWEETEKKEWILVEGGLTTLDDIPFVPFYGARLAFMCGVSPLLDLAYQNVKHWQQQSDQDDSARFARKRLLVFSGITEDSEIIASSHYSVKLPQGATATVVQGSAESVTVGRTELDALEAQMITTGAELLVVKPGEQKSATQSNNDAEGNKSDLQRISENFADSIDQCLQFMAEWLKEPTGGHVTLFSDYGAGSLSDASAQLIISMQQGGLITKETAIREQQRRGTLSPDIDPEAELDAVAEEGPKLGEITDEDIDPLTGLPRKPEPAAG